MRSEDRRFGLDIDPRAARNQGGARVWNNGEAVDSLGVTVARLRVVRWLAPYWGVLAYALGFTDLGGRRWGPRRLD